MFVCVCVCVRNGNRIRGAVGGGLDRGIKTLISLEKAETDVKEQEKSVEKESGRDDEEPLRRAQQFGLHLFFFFFF